jgi:putative hemolysin
VGDWVIWVGIALVAVLTFFTTLNFALRVPSRARIAEQFERAGRTEQWEGFVIDRPRFLLATAVLRTAAAMGLLLIFLRLLPPDGLIVAFALALLVVLVFGIAVPNAWAKHGGEVLIVRALPVLRAVRLLCHPLIVMMELFDPLVRRLCGVPVLDAKAYADELEQEILNAVSEMEQRGAVDEEEKEMIESVIELRDTLVEEIMTPRTDIVAIPADAGLEDVKAIVRTKGHSRIPVYGETIDTVLGVLYAKDLIPLEDGVDFNARQVMRKVSFIPESKHVRDLLHEFQEQKVHIAVVLDEYGGTAGLVTIEDILEELVGEIADEYETTEPATLKRIDADTVEVDARMNIDDLNDELNIDLPEDEDFETVGGFVFSTMGKIPQVGETCAHNNVALTVIAAGPRRITRLKLRITRPQDNGQASPTGRSVAP